MGKGASRVHILYQVIHEQPLFLLHSIEIEKETIKFADIGYFLYIFPNGILNIIDPVLHIEIFVFDTIWNLHKIQIEGSNCTLRGSNYVANAHLGI